MIDRSRWGTIIPQDSTANSLIPQPPRKIQRHRPFQIFGSKQHSYNPNNNDYFYNTMTAAHPKKNVTSTAASARIPIPDIKHPHHIPYDELESQKQSAYKAEHMHSLMALCCVIFTFGYLVISVFPYSGFMAIELVSGVNEENAGYYAGLISSSFMAGRALTSYHWGKAADVYGRVTVLMSSLVLSLVFTLLFGLSGSFTLALIWRFLLYVSKRKQTSIDL